MHKIGNIAIIVNFIFLYNCNFLLHLHQLMLVNLKYNVRWYKTIAFQDCRLHQPSQFLIAQLKRSWQYWNSCIVGILWKTPVCARLISADFCIADEDRILTVVIFGLATYKGTRGLTRMFSTLFWLKGSSVAYCGTKLQRELKGSISSLLLAR